MAIGTTAALLGSAAIGAGASLLGGSSANRATDRAVQSSERTAATNNALLGDIYNRNEARLSPYDQRGNAAGNSINALLGFGSDQSRVDARSGFRHFMENSDYGFQFGEGANAINSGYAANGALQSGAAMKAMEKYRQDLQSGYRGEYMNLLGNQQGVGLSGASAVAGVGQNYANGIVQNNNIAGTNAANAALMRGANTSNMYAGIGNSLGMAIGGLGSSYRGSVPPGFG